MSPDAILDCSTAHTQPQAVPEEIPAMLYTGWKTAAVKGSYKPKPLAKHDVDFVVTYTGICASDLHQVDGDWKVPLDWPLVPGHEVVGHVINVGEAVKDFKIGDVVGLGAQAQSCHNCEWCHAGSEIHCEDSVYSYVNNTTDETGTHRHYGGFGAYIRTDSRFVFHIPKEIEEKYAGPLMCAGNAVAPPLFEWAKGEDAKGKRVGIIGIGGLGHLAIQFAAKMGAEVWAISHNDDAKKFTEELGAVGYINFSDKEAVKAATRTLDFLMICFGGDKFDIDAYSKLMRAWGTIHIVGIPNGPLTFNTMSLMHRNLTLKASLIGGRPATRQMLAFAAKHGVRPIVEVFPHTKCDEAMQKIRDGTIRFRAVLRNDLL